MNIHPTARIECDEFIAGPGLTVRAHAEIYGTRVVLGRECFVDEYAVIGGGSAGELEAGDWLHLGMFSQVNTARPVRLGSEVGLGIGTRVFTHGAYLSEWDGFPVSFDGVSMGDRVWLPNAIVLPGVSIGSDVVVGAGSVVTKDLDDGSLYAGCPAAYLGPSRRVVDQALVLKRIVEEAGVEASVTEFSVTCRGADFYVRSQMAAGRVSEESERLRNQLRRHGIRFRVDAVDGQYEAWS